MNVERQYLEALDLTHQMLAATRNQDWDALTRIGKQRSGIIEAVERANLPIPASEKVSVAKLITEMERENAEIMERVQSWQKDVRILLRMKEQPG